ncbi:MAG: M48 family metallopeptidase [Bacteroidetes bacterium]|nr:M48 family metallopeptidase [Bacteroidota bacterium]
MKKIILPAVAFSLLMYGCHKNAVTGKRSLSLVPENELIGMSVQQYAEFLQQNPPLPDSDERVQMVKRSGTKIQKAVEKYYADKGASKDLEAFQWEFNVVNSDEINAWCMPGGKVAVYTGILPVTQDEQSLAVVMGHEVAHAVARHGNQRMSQSMITQFGGAALSTAMGQNPSLTGQLFQQAVGFGSTLGALKFSRKHESEADEMGLIFAAMAGYNPEAAITFWQRMANSGGQKPPEILSTHPSDETRIKNLQAFMPTAMKYYKP